ncbi:MAG TPA: CPBP family glutamic-type intramembrane protease [Candidatus Saccharimonadales bacterium]|nr:CPBP family glutamic-type intramembrane protease [Candidatus Saccharimonadales bacterium]
MEELLEASRGLVVIGLTLLLAMLRLDAERFGTAEYYEATRDGERPRVRRRLAWYGLGAGLVILMLYIHPAPQRDLFLGSGDRLGAVMGGLVYAGIGVAQAVVFAWLRYHRIRFPDTWSYPGALLNSTATAFIDEATFRGAIFGFLLSTGLEPTVANLIQTLLYALTTRLGAPGRDRYLLVLTLGMGLIGGWLTAATGGIAAAFLGAAVTRFAVFLCTGHTGQTMPRGREVEEIEKRRRPPDGWRVIGSRESASRDR